MCVYMGPTQRESTVLPTGVLKVFGAGVLAHEYEYPKPREGLEHQVTAHRQSSTWSPEQTPFPHTPLFHRYQHLIKKTQTSFFQKRVCALKEWNFPGHLRQQIPRFGFHY